MKYVQRNHKTLPRDCTEYVQIYLSDASELFLQDIVSHGIFNTGADVHQGDTDAEYNDIQDAFKQHASKLLEDR